MGWQNQRTELSPKPETRKAGPNSRGRLFSCLPARTRKCPAARIDVAAGSDAPAGQAIGQTVAKTSLFKEVTPGKHTITSEAENTATLAGKPTFVWQEVKTGVLSARSKLNLVDAEQGKAGVKESDLPIAK